LPTPGGAIAGTKPHSLQIELPSGTMITPTMIDAKPMVHREMDVLLRKCQANSPDAVGFYQEGSRSAIAALAAIKITKLTGSAILFYPQKDVAKPTPKQYAAYRNDMWHGLLATWDEQGRRKYWGNYANGQRQGVCCLFEGDVLTAVMECSRNKPGAVHLIAANAVTKSFTAEEAMSDQAAGVVLAKLDSIEKDAKEDARQLRERVKHGVQSRIGALNNEKRDAFEERSTNRAKAKDQTFRAWRRQTGVP
jgi:antitoxin component YwqK of YwqJK toxin-antitoxin module